jgi:polysaccharide deacetylase 2 family uncharacterized protein YibQ
VIALPDPRAVIGLAGAGWARVMTGGALRTFWLMVGSALASAALTLHLLGPVPIGPVPGPQAPAPHTPAARSHDDASATAPEAPPARGAIPAPIDDLQESAPGQPGQYLPSIAADGRMPMHAYAAPFRDPANRPRIGVLLTGMGLNSADSEAAIRALPGAISLAFSAYADRPGRLLEAARAGGHETLLGLPLEPAGTPLHDAGNQALLVSATAEQNARRLDWALARMGGYVGATGALGALRGEFFAESGVPMREMLETLAARGLLYIDPRPGAALGHLVAGRAVDLVIDTPQHGMVIDHALHQLEQIARERGAALGLAGAPVPLTIGRLAAWAAGLEARGFVLAPVSALVADPAPMAQAAPPVRGRAQ